jgi:hypothetical protein
MWNGLRCADDAQTQIQKEDVPMRCERTTLCWLAAAVVLAGLLDGCALPNLKPFAESTAQLHAAVAKADTDVPALLREAGKPDEADKLDKHLDVRRRAMNAVLTYAESLAHITEAGQSGQKSADRVADSLGGLLGTLKLAPLSSEAVSVVTTVYGQVAQARAAGAFADAVGQADPAIQAVAAVLTKDFKDLQDLLIQMRPVLLRRVMDRSSANVALDDYRHQLERQRRQIESGLGADPGNAGLIRQSQDISLLIGQTRDRYEPLLAEQAAIGARVDTQIALMAKTRQAVSEWAAVHADMAAAVRAGLPPNTAVLASIAVQIHQLSDGAKAR